ncbi:zinc metalloprotease [Kaistella haifensis]|nr:zinc metalloprotease [Kaistella haifensis]
MKKLLMGAFALSMLVACNAGDENLLNQEGNDLTANSSGASAQRVCPSEEIREEALAKNPELMAKFTENESLTKQFANDLALGKVLSDGTVEIPVVVNVLYRTSAENISDAQIASQIATLNNDFGGTNSDVNKIPSEFASVAAGDTKIKFRLDRVIRKSTTVRSWQTNDAMKKTSSKGQDAFKPANYFNIWVVGEMGGVLGYATFPESAGLWNDGVVIAGKYFGNTSSAPYNLGRTATHEVGHYLNLRHIWGDGNCATDFVDDTPTQQDKNFGKPTYPQYDLCGGVNRSIQFMNYMDYVDDAAMYMFSSGQKARMMAVTSTSGPRAGLRVY